MSATKLFGAGVLLLAITWSAPSVALPCDAEALIRADAQIKAALPNTAIQRITCSPIAGLYQVETGTNLIYMDPTGRHMLVGSIFDLASGRDLTQPTLDRLAGAPRAAKPENRQVVKRRETAWIDWATLPAESIRWGNPGGPKVAVFSDPRCPYCAVLNTALLNLGADVHEYLFPILGPASQKLSKEIWCARDRAAALKSAFSKEPFETAPSCDTAAIDAASSFATAAGFTGTPILIRDDGQVKIGIRPEALEGWLAESTLTATDKKAASLARQGEPAQ